MAGRVLLILLIAGLPSARAASHSCDAAASSRSGTGEARRLASRVRAALPPAEVLAIADALDETAIRCPGRIWPGSYLARTPVLIVDSGAKRAWVWNGEATGEPGSLERVPWRRIERSPELLAPYSFPAWRGRPATSINLAMHRSAGGRLDWRHAFRFAVHESFHRHEQMGASPWRLPPPPEGSEISWSERARRVPSDPEPRYLRSQMLRALRRAALEPGRREASLAEAAHWRGRFESEFPDEAARARRTDILESSARAVEILSLAVAESGCGATEGAIRERISEMIGESPSSDALHLFHDDAEPQTESYDLAVAWLLDRETGGSAWAERAREAIHPAALLDGRGPSSPPEDQGRRAVIARWERTADEEALPFVESAAAAFESPDVVRIALPRAGSQGAFASWGFFVNDRLPGSVLSRELTRSVRVGASRVEVSVDYRGGGEPVPMLYRLDTPCASEEEQVVFLVPARALRPASGAREFRLPGIEGSITGTETTGEEGLRWLCPGRAAP